MTASSSPMVEARVGEITKGRSGNSDDVIRISFYALRKRPQAHALMLKIICFQ